jgi:uncharacterized protein (DUF2225 family)
MELLASKSTFSRPTLVMRAVRRDRARATTPHLHPVQAMRSRESAMTTILRDVTLQCPVCGSWFSSRAVVSASYSVGTRTDFHRRADGVQPLAHEVHRCGACGFAGLRDEFADDPVSAASARESAHGSTPEVAGEETVGSEKYEAAAETAERRGAGPKAVADLLLRAAWCCADEDDVEAERFFRRKAAWAFETVLSRYDEVPREERAVLTYLVGELWRRVGDTACARLWFDRVPQEVDDPATQRWILALAVQQRDRPTEWLS